MLRRRPPHAGSFVADDDDPPLKKYGSGKTPKRVDPRVLVSTLSAAVLSALNPSSDVRSQAYSEYLTDQVQNLTIGWHIFRTVTEGAFLASYGLAIDTTVVQIFWSLSVGSVLLYFAARSVWLAWREGICVLTNLTYGIITVLKIFHLVPRLPNENHYMFKHCFLTMADAAFSQTPVHKQYVVQFLEAVIRVVVWRRYNVLADTPTWGVIVVSLAWQLWLVTFSSMLQARHVSAFRRHRASAASTSTLAPAAGASSNPASGRSQLSTAVGASRPGSCEIEPSAAGASTSAAAETAAAIAAAAAPPAPVAASVVGLSSRPTLRVTRSPRNSIGAASGMVGAALGGDGGLAAETSRISSTLSAGSSSKKRFLRALRGVARGPSSYVLLSHQRRQAGGPQCATAQFYIPTANPDMLSGNWRERLATAISEGAPGWQVAGVCVRRGSLIVHLDLVYAPTGHGAAAAPVGSAVVVSGAAAGGNGEGCFSGVSYSEQPFDFVAGSSPKEILDEYMGGMGADSLLELLGLSPDLPAGPLQPISVQVGHQLRNLPSTVEAAPASVADMAAAAPAADAAAAAEPPAAVPAPAPVAVAVAATAVTSTTSEAATTDAKVAAAAAAAGAFAPEAAAWRRLLALPLLTVLHPPTELRSREYAAFLSERVGPLHVAYASFISLAVLLLFVLRGGRGVSPLTLALFSAAELLTLASGAALGGFSSPAWRGARCGMVYAGVAARTLQMAACTFGFLPHVLRDTDCVSDRWIQKVVLITTLQALCMQPPVRTFFLIRAPSVLLSTYVHVFVCRTHLAIGTAMALHMGWEALLFLISANLQYRHLEAFRRRRLASQRHTAGGCCQLDAAAAEAEGTAGEDGAKDSAAAAAVAAEVADASTPATAGDAAPAGPPQDDKQQQEQQQEQLALDLNPTAAAAAAGFVAAAAAGDPYDVSLSAPLVAIAPRRAARLQLRFTCAPAVVEELQVVLRHINPAAMSSGVHTAHAVRDITRGLVAPAGAAAAPPLAPAPFSAELTLVASPADMPGLVHVELWRGRRRITSHPVLLAATPEAPPADGAAAAGMPALYGGSDCAADGGTWLDDVRAYLSGLREQGHGAAADQFVEELGSWLAQAAALERGLTASASAAGSAGGAGGPTAGGAARVANVLYFHGYGSEFMYIKPRRVSGAGGAGGAAATAPVADPLHNTLRQLLLCQGSMLLAVAVEAGAVALSRHLVGLMVGGEVGATLAGLLETARTPVTQLPLLHAAVKSGDARMVDMVAEWSASCGLKDIWAAEVAILAVSLGESCAGSTACDNTASTMAASTGHGAGTGGFVKMAAARRSSRSLLLQTHSHWNPASDQQNTSPFRPPESRAGDVTGPDGAAAAAGYAFEQDQAFLPPTDIPAFSSVPDAFTDLIDLDTDAEGQLDPSEESPFRIIDFRAANRAAAAGAAAAAAGAGATAAAAPEAAVTGRSSGRSVGGVGSGSIGPGCSRSSLDSAHLVDSGVLVLTPLHMSLALSDKGQLASHILRTYPEAYELWRSSQLSVGLDSSVSGGGGGSIRLEGSPSTNPSSSIVGDVVLLRETSVCSSGAGAGTGTMATLLGGPAGAGAAFSSLPGLIHRLRANDSGRGGGGAGGGGAIRLAADDSMETGSLQSMSLSEVAFFEGFRWVDDDVTTRRPGFKITRM